MNKQEVKDILGDFLEGVDTQNSSKKLLQEALKGAIHTNQGPQRYYIDLDALLLDNIDLSEAIWSLGEGEKYAGDISEVVFLDKLKSIEDFKSKVINQENGVEKWLCLESKIVNKLRADND